MQGDRRDAYVKITLNQQYRPIKEKKTGIARPAADDTVTFTEGFNLRLPPTQVDTTSVAFHVYQVTSGYGRGNKFIRYPGLFITRVGQKLTFR